MGQYTEAEIKEFREKDKRISRMACLKAAVEYSAGCEVTPEDILRNADTFLGWVYQEDKPAENVVQPQPTLEQKKAIDYIEKETGWDYDKIWNTFKEVPSRENFKELIEKIEQLNCI